MRPRQKRQHCVLSFRVKSSTTNETLQNLFISDRIEAGAEISKRSSLSIQEMLARHITRSLRDFRRQKLSIHLNFNSQSICGRVLASESRDSMTTLENMKMFMFSAIYFRTQALRRVLDAKNAWVSCPLDDRNHSRASSGAFSCPACPRRLIAPLECRREAIFRDSRDYFSNKPGVTQIFERSLKSLEECKVRFKMEF